MWARVLLAPAASIRPDAPGLRPVLLARGLLLAEPVAEPLPRDAKGTDAPPVVAMP